MSFSQSNSARRAAGLLMIRLDAKEWGSAAYRDAAYALIDRGIGGIGVFLGGLEQTAAMIEDVQRRARRRLLVAADFEFGLPMRLDGGIAYPRAMALGRTRPETTQRVARLIAEEARAIGVHWNWAPVADVNSNPLNPIINTRSFGEDSNIASLHVQAYIRGLREGGLLSCAKHFPGHGDTTVDSHLDLPTIDVPHDVAHRRELVPFRAAIQEQVDSVMVGHIVAPYLDPNLPASLSKKVVTDCLRHELGYKGLVITDALDMHAIADRWPSGEASVMSVEAGADVVLMPDNVEQALSALETAISSGRITEQQLGAAEQRWEEARAGAGCRTNSSAPRTRQPIIIDQATHAMAALQAADEAIRVEGSADALPLTKYTHIAALAAISDSDMDDATIWFQSLTQAVEINIDCGYIDGTITTEQMLDLRDGLQEADVIVVALFGKAKAYRGSLPGFEELPRVLQELAADRPLILVACGSPYGLDQFQTSTTIYTYSDTAPSIAASVLRLIGRTMIQN